MNPARLGVAILVASTIPFPLRAESRSIVGPAAVPPSVISNGGFDTGLQNWSPSGSAAWQATDAKGNPASGSVRLLAPAGGATALVSKCLFLTPGKTYVASALAWISQAGSSDGTIIAIGRHTNPGCSGVAVTAASYIARGQAGRWVPLSVAYSVPAGTQSVSINWAVFRNSGTPAVTAYFDEAAVRETSCSPLPPGNCFGCRPGLCLDGERFRVEATWKTPGGQEGVAQPIPFTTESGSFWFFSSTNIELDVKILDGCGVNGRHWVFASGGTNVEVTLFVTDTKTGTVKTYTNPQGRLFQTIADTSAFASCL
jgi:hypothetical protein